MIHLKETVLNGIETVCCIVNGKRMYFEKDYRINYDIKHGFFMLFTDFLEEEETQKLLEKYKKKYHAKSLTDINGVIKPLGTFDFLVCEDLMKKYIKWSEDYKDALDIYYSLVDQLSD